MRSRLTRPALAFALLTPGLLALAAFAKPPADDNRPQFTTFHGKVVPLAEALKKRGVPVDPDGPAVLALETDSGQLYPLVKDAGGRTVYHDENLLRRPMRIDGRLLPGTQLLQVFRIYSLKDGRPHEVYYWCDVCAIKRLSREKSGICECCGGPMELREVPVEEK
jgi:hypothetical protein